MSHFPPRTRNVVGCLSVAILTLTVSAFLPATEPPADKEKTDPAEKTRTVIDEVLGRHEVFPDAESKEPLKAVPALRWSNNTRGTNNALTVLYVRNGRPYAAACLFPYDRGMIHDFQSLARADDKIVVRGGGRTVWEPRKAGVEYAPIPDAPAPKGTRGERLLQIKQLAGRFESTMLGWRIETNDQEKLRLLPQPIYRYDPTGGTVIDGAVFAFVQGTDPESLLLIELVKEGPKPRWVFAFARRTAGKLEGRLDGKVVWTAPLNPEYKDVHGPHYTIHIPLDPPPGGGK